MHLGGQHFIRKLVNGEFEFSNDFKTIIDTVKKHNKDLFESYFNDNLYPPSNADPYKCSKIAKYLVPIVQKHGVFQINFDLINDVIRFVQSELIGLAIQDNLLCQTINNYGLNTT